MPIKKETKNSERKQITNHKQHNKKTLHNSSHNKIHSICQCTQVSALAAPTTRFHSSRFYFSNLLLIFTVLYFESFNVQRLTDASILGTLRNLADEWESCRSGNLSGIEFPPETFLSTPEIIRLHGYQVEEHKVETKDGYVLSIFRIIHNKTEPVDNNENDINGKDAELNGTRKLEPVLIQHGFVCSSDDFLVLNPKDILPYLLVDSGHNVWLGNFRGSTYGKEHVNNTSSTDPEFYNFSKDDAARDVSEMIRFILKVENASQLSYVCHSTGCTLISMAVSDHPELNQLIKKGSFMAPGPYFSHMRSPPVLAILYLPEVFLSTYSQLFSGGRLMSSGQTVALRKYAPGICLRETKHDFCKNALAFLAGLNPEQITTETLVKVFGHFPADTSMKLFIQVLQYVKSDKFQKYDYGNEKNLEFYGSVKPPLYNLSRVTFPVQGFYGLNDDLVPVKDLSRTWSELGNLVEKIQVKDEKWTHLDFLYGKKARKLVYDKIVQFLSS